MLSTFRKTLFLEETTNNWTLVWSKDQIPATSFVLKSSGGRIFPLQEGYPGFNQHYGHSYFRSLGVPPEVPEGKYVLQNEGVEYFELSIQNAPRTDRAISVSPDNSASEIQKAMEQAVDKKKALIFDPGSYVLNHGIRVPEGLWADGFGAHLFRLPNHDYAERMLIGGAYSTFRGFTFHPWEMIAHSEVPSRGMSFRDCRFVGGANFGYSYIESLFQDCVFDGLGCVGVPHGLYLRCRFICNEGSHAFMAHGPCNGALALVDCIFDGTDRGPVFGLNNGSVTDNLIFGLCCRNIQRDQNGNEIVMSEGTYQNDYEFSRNLIIGTRVSNCDSNLVQFWDRPARDNFILDTVMRGGGGSFWIAGVNGVEQTGNIFDQFELSDGAGVQFGWRDGYGHPHGSGVSGNVFRNGAFCGFRTGRLNQGSYDPRFYSRRSVVDIVDCGPGNLFEDVSFVDLPTGVSPFPIPSANRIEVSGCVEVGALGVRGIS